MKDLVDVSEVVRRVVSARVRDAHLVEDLIQETLVKVAAAEHRLAPSARQAYAIVTARNVITSHARSQAIHHRHAHRLVDYTTPAGPEQLALEREETDALTVALQRLDAADRELLLRHEADGVSTAALATDAETTPGAVAMRLARARATLRLEFVLAYRRLTLPTARCRPVLLALSVGDKRRQVTLNAADHLLSCSTCARLARPITEHRRSMAAWLFIPLGEAAHRTVRTVRRSRLAQAAAVTVTAAAVATMFVVTRPQSPDSDAGVVPSSTSTTTTTTTTIPPQTTTPPPACPPPAPLEQSNPTTILGCPIAATTLTATDVPADEGFWATTSAGTVVWVQLFGPGESPVTIIPGTSIVVTGTISDPAAAGVAGGDPRIDDAGFILEVPFTSIAAN